MNTMTVRKAAVPWYAGVPRSGAHSVTITQRSGDIDVTVTGVTVGRGIRLACFPEPYRRQRVRSADGQES